MFSRKEQRDLLRAGDLVDLAGVLGARRGQLDRRTHGVVGLGGDAHRRIVVDAAAPCAPHRSRTTGAGAGTAVAAASAARASPSAGPAARTRCALAAAGPPQPPRPPPSPWWQRRWIESARHRRRHEARAHDENTDALLVQGVAEALTERVQRRLGGAVDDVGLPGALGGDRGEHDQRPAAVVAQALRRCAAAASPVSRTLTWSTSSAASTSAGRPPRSPRTPSGDDHEVEGRRAAPRPRRGPRRGGPDRGRRG